MIITYHALDVAEWIRREKHNMTDQTSELLYREQNSGFRRRVNSPVRAYQAVGRTPRFIQSAKGSPYYRCGWK